MKVANLSARGKEEGSLKYSYFAAWIVHPYLPKSKDCRLNRAIIYSDKGNYTASAELIATYLWFLQNDTLQMAKKIVLCVCMWGKGCCF